MQVIVKLFASLARFEITVSEFASLQTVIDQLGIPPEETKVSFVNGLIRDLDWTLNQGDEVGIFPPIGGG
jgi:molybdopterin converting factor small subunit